MTQNNTYAIYSDLLDSFKSKYDDLSTKKEQISTIGNRTLTKTREYEIANNNNLKELAHIEKLKVTVIYLLICIGILGLIYIYILPKKLGYIFISLVGIANILTVIFINNNFYKRYNLNYAMFRFYTDPTPETENNEPELVCTPATNN